MEKLSFEKLQEKYATKHLSLSEMEKVNGGCADFSDVTVKVDTTACPGDNGNPFYC